MKCPTPIWIPETEKTQGTYVPCGRCYACLQTKRSVWTFRILQELKEAQSARFITLTYTEETVPYIIQWNRFMIMELNKKDLQKFLKRLRQKIVKDYGDNRRWTKFSNKSGKVSSKIRYFACGEYGSSTDRPHYHIILFNAPLSYFKYDPIHKKEYSPTLEQIWKNGKVDIGKVEHGSVHYVTKYHMFPLLLDWDQNDQREKPFALMSKGIGKNYINASITNYYIKSKNSYATLKNGIRQPLGRYYKEKISEEIDPIEGREMQRRSKEYAIEQEKKERERYGSESDFMQAKRDEYRERTKEFKRLLKKNNKL